MHEISKSTRAVGKWGMTLDDACCRYIENCVYGGTESSRRGKLYSMLGGYRTKREMMDFVCLLRKYLTGITWTPKADRVTNTIADEIEKKINARGPHNKSEGRIFG